MVETRPGRDGPDGFDPDEEGRRAWGQYLSAADNRQTVDACMARSRPRFAPLRDILRRLVENVEPETAVCLGSGPLNDLPFQSLVCRSRHLHLVDWISGLADQGIAGSAVVMDAREAPECVFCGLGEVLAEDYCKDYSGPAYEGAGVCSNYVTGKDGVACANYRRGCRPQVHDDDVTGGYASDFAGQILTQVNASKTRGDAYGRATRLARRLTGQNIDRGRLPIADGCADLVLSSMVISQFEWEPYGFFARLAERRFGPVEGPGKKKALKQSGILRDTLFRNALDRHLKEIRRMLKPDGVGFLAFEMFHRETADGVWFLVSQMHEAVGRIDQMFDFDFDLLPAADHFVEIKEGEACSLVYCFALRPKVAA